MAIIPFIRRRLTPIGSFVYQRGFGHFISMVLLCIAIVAIHSPLLNNDFLLYDDQSVVTQNPLVHAGSLQEIFSSYSAGLYHPLTTLSWAWEGRIFGFDPFVFHLTNLLLHMLAAMLVMLLARRLWPDKFAAPVILAALFAFHPLHVESVAWVSERKDVLCQVFYLLALVLHVGRKPHKALGITRYILVLLAFVCALLAKPMAVTLPLVLIACELYLDYPQLHWRMLYDKIPHLAIAAVVGVVTVIGQSQVRDGSPLPENILTGLMNSAKLVTLCLAKTVWPNQLSVIYESTAVTFDWFLLLGAALIPLIFIGAFLRILPWRRDALFGLAFFGITLLPVIRVVQFGDASLFNDRFFYLPGIGLLFGFVALAEAMGKVLFSTRYVHGILCAFWMALISMMALSTFQRCRVWQNDETLFLDALHSYPASASAHSFLAQYYSSMGRHREAATHYQKALDVAPGTPLRTSGLAYSLFFDGKKDDALAVIASAKSLWPNNAEVLYTTALFFLEMDQLAYARDHLRKALVAPDTLAVPYRFVQKARIYNTLAVIAYRQKSWPEALESSSLALEGGALLPETHYNRGLILRALLRHREAEDAMLRALELNPHLTEALADLAVIHWEEGDEIAAMNEMERAVGLSPDNTRYRCNLGLFLQTRGRLAEAEYQFNQALRVDPTSSCARQAAIKSEPAAGGHNN